LRRWYCSYVGEYVVAFLLKTLFLSKRGFLFYSILCFFTASCVKIFTVSFAVVFIKVAKAYCGELCVSRGFGIANFAVK
ncbi:hypothetical protein, partial [Flavobacterium sp. Root420]|uniref:hypothetical protein n=1 Tax=Flavobacterium sp. Root420 TaxID=1736533 RepID=UPI0019D6C165